MKTVAVAIAMLAALCSYTGDATAQNNAFYSSIHRGYANNRMLFNQRAAMSAALKGANRPAAKGEERGSSGAATGAVPAGTASKDLPISACQFRPATRSPVMPAKLARAFVPDGTPDAAEARLNVEKTLTKIYDEYQVNVRKAGQEFDMARATGAYIMLSYGTATDRELTFDEFKGVVQQVRAICAADAKFRSQSAQQKQEEYEFLVIMGQLVAIASDGAKRQGSTAVLADVQKMAEDNIQSLLGVPTRRLRFNNSGYEIVS